MPVLGSGPGCGGTDTEGGLTHSSTLMKPRGSWRRPQRIPPRTRSCGERAAGAGAPGRHQGLLRGTGGTAPGDWGGYTGGCSEGQGGLHRGTGELQRELARAGGCSGTPDCCTRTAAGRWEAAPGVAPGHRGRGALHRELHGRTGGCTGGCMGTPGAAPGVTPGVAPGHRGAASGDCPGHLGVRGGGGLHRSPTWSRGPLSPAAGAAGSDMAGPGAVGAASAARWDRSAVRAATGNPTAPGAGSTAPPPARPPGPPPDTPGTAPSPGPPPVPPPSADPAHSGMGSPSTTTRGGCPCVRPWARPTPTGSPWGPQPCNGTGSPGAVPASSSRCGADSPVTGPHRGELDAGTAPEDPGASRCLCPGTPSPVTPAR